jgi:hypothetical protein
VYSPAAHVRRPRLDYESHATAPDRADAAAVRGQRPRRAGAPSLRPHHEGLTSLPASPLGAAGQRSLATWSYPRTGAAAKPSAWGRRWQSGLRRATDSPRPLAPGDHWPDLRLRGRQRCAWHTGRDETAIQKALDTSPAAYRRTFRDSSAA